MSEAIQPDDECSAGPLEEPVSFLISQMLATVRRLRLFAPGEHILIGVSGGPDSTALLHALSALRGSWNLAVSAAHLNHGFRGAEAEAEAQFVSDLCTRLAIPIHTRSEDVPARKRRQHLSSQEAARRSRHAFLLSTADAIGADYIALGHTRDDRVETVLLNLLRGTGVEGLTALPAASGRIIRPLLEVDRAATHAYCAQYRLDPRSDSSNSNLDYRRNRVRSELLPYLTTYYNQRVEDAILRLSNIVVAENEVLTEIAGQNLKSVTRQESRVEIVLDVASLMALPIALQRRVLRMAIEKLRGHLQGIGFDIVEHVLANALTAAVSFDLPAMGAETFRIRGDGRSIVLEKKILRASPVPWQIRISEGDEIRLPGGEWAVRAFGPGNNSQKRTEPEYLSSLRSNEPMGLLVFSRDSITFPLVARTWQHGDRIRLRGLNGSKKLQDLFTDRGVLPAQRTRLPILVEDGGKGRILAVAGLAVGESDSPMLSGKIDWDAVFAETDRYMMISLRRISRRTEDST